MLRSLPWKAVVVALFLMVSSLLAIAAAAVDPPKPEPPAQPATPEALKLPKGQVFLFAWRAEGVQVYECQVKRDPATEFEWALKAPEAILFDDRGEKVGTHTAGPTWEAKDGSKIVAVKMATAPSASGRAVPWLLLRVTSHEGTGAFSKVSYVQRVDTWAGLPPAEGATKENAGKQVRVKYEATYRFYGADNDPAEEVPPGFSKELGEAAKLGGPRTGSLAKG